MTNGGGVPTDAIIVKMSVKAGTMTAGHHSRGFDASALPSGLYVYRRNANEFSAAKEMVLIR